MTMKMLEAGGLEVLTDGLRAADDSNPKGYYEFEKVKRLDRDHDKSWLADAKGKAVKIISFLLPHLPEINNYKVIFMHRDMREVIASQNKMLSDRGEPAGTTSDERMLALYGNHLKKVTRLIARRSCFDVLEVDYGEVLAGPLAQATRINAFLGGTLHLERMAEMVDLDLYRNRK